MAKKEDAFERVNDAVSVLLDAYQDDPEAAAELASLVLDAGDGGGAEDYSEILATLEVDDLRSLVVEAGSMKKKEAKKAKKKELIASLAEVDEDDLAEALKGVSRHGWRR